MGPRPARVEAVIRLPQGMFFVIAPQPQTSAHSMRHQYPVILPWTVDTLRASLGPQRMPAVSRVVLLVPFVSAYYFASAPVTR